MYGVWLKENWFKAGLIVALIVALGFYWFSWKPMQEREDALAKNIKCQQDGMRLHETEKSGSSDQTYGDAEFVFSKELNTCLYRTIVAESTTQYVSYTRLIKDVYTNKTLAFYTTYIKEDETNETFGDVEAYRELEEYFSSPLQ